MTGRLAPVAGAAAVAALVVAAGVGRPATERPHPAGATVLPVTAARLVCPGLDGSPTASGQVTVADVSRILGGSGAPQVTLSAMPEGTAPAAVAAPVALTLNPAQTISFHNRLPATTVVASGPGAVGVAASQHGLVPDGVMRSVLSAPCLPATSDTWLTGADGRVGRDDVLVLANPGSTDAAVTVTAWSAAGPVDLPGLQSYPVAAGHSAALDLAHYAPDAAMLTLHIHADAGRVAAQVRDSQSAGLSPAGTDWLPPTTAPAREQVVDGFLPADGPRLLLVTNPGRDDATVGLRLYVRDRAFVPAGHPQLVVPPGRTSLLDLSTSLGGDAAAVQLTSDRPIVAAGESQVTHPGGFPDIAWHPATDALSGPAVLAESVPPFASHPLLLLTAVGGPAQVRLVPAAGSPRIVTVEGDRTVSVDLTAVLGPAASGPLVLVPLTGRVWASRALDAVGTHGPLVTSMVPVPVSPPLRLPAVREDLQVAVR